MNGPATSRQFSRNNGVKSILLFLLTVSVFVVSVFLLIRFFISIVNKPKDSNSELSLTPSAETVGQVKGLANVFDVNIEGNFNKPTNFKDDTFFSKQAALLGGFITQNANADLGTGEITAANIIYRINAGSGITVSGDPQNPTISAITQDTGVTSFQGKKGALKLTAGSGITISGLQISNNDPGSAQNIFKNVAVTGQDTVVAGGNDDTLTFVPGAGITLTTDATGKSITITNANFVANDSGWGRNGTNVSLTTAGDLVGIGTATPGFKLDVVGSVNAGSLYIGGVQVTATPAELNVLDGTTISTAEINLLSGRSGVLLDSSNISTYATTGITAGSGLVGGGTSGVLSLNVGAGDGVTVNADAITLDVVTAGVSATTATNSGLELRADGLRLLGGCADSEFLSWDSASQVWKCTPATVSGGSGTTHPALSLVTSGLNFLTLNAASQILTMNAVSLTSDVSGILSAANGGTGVNGGTAPSGTLLLGNGAGFSIRSMGGDALLASDGLLTLANSGVTSGSYGSTLGIPVLSVDSKGRVISASTSALNLTFESPLTFSDGLLRATNTITVDATTTGTTSTTASNSGLEVTASGVRLLGGCATNEVLAWNSGNSTWYCSSLIGVGGLIGAGLTNYNAKFTNVNTLTAGIIYDDGVNIGIGTTAPSRLLEVAGAARVNGNLYLNGTTYYINDGTSNLNNITTDGSYIRGYGGTEATPFFSNRNDTDTGMYLPTGNVVAFSTNGSEKFRIDGSGNVGIGTTNPTANLHINGSAKISQYLQFTSYGAPGGSGNILFGNGVTNYWSHYIGDNSEYYIDYSSNGSSWNNLVKLTRNGKVSIYGDVTIANGSDVFKGTIGLGSTGPSNITSGAYVIGAFDEFTYSNSATVQGVLNDLDNEISTIYSAIGGTAPTHSPVSLTTNGYSYLALNSLTQVLTLGAVSLTSDVSGVLSVSNGGTGINSATAPVGSLLIGNGSGFSLSTLSGDATLISDGTLTLANSGVGAGTYGSGTGIPVLLVDAKGRITSASTAALNLNFENPLTFSNGLSRATNTITVDGSTTGTTSTTASNSGLEVSADGVRMLGGCGNNEVLAWNSGNNTWYCTSVGGVGALAGSGTPNYLARFSGTSSLTTGILYDNGTYVGVGTTNPTAALDVAGSAKIERSLTLTYVGNGTGDGIIADDGNGTGSKTFSLTRNTESSMNSLSISAWNGMGFSTGSNSFLNRNSYKMFLTSAGNLGIGTTNPTAALDVAGDAKANNFYVPINGFVGYNGGQGLLLGNSTTLRSGSGPLSFVQNGSTRLVLSAASSYFTNALGIGTTSPAYALDVVGDIRIATGSDLRLGSILLGGTGSSNTTSGAYKVGSFDEFTYSNSGTVQSVLKDFDTQLGLLYSAVGGTSPSHSPVSLTTNGYSYLSLATVSQTLTMSAISLTSDVSGVLSVSNGGTGINSATAPVGSLLIGNVSGFSLSTLGGDATLISDGTLTLANSGVGAGTYGSTTGIPVITVDAKGRITSASTTPLSSGGVVFGSGTTNYLARFSNNNTLTTGSIYDSGTNVGIGTTNPLGTLELNHDGSINAVSSTLYLMRNHNNSGYGAAIWNGHGNGLDYLAFGAKSNGDPVASEAMRIVSGGDIGIGTTLPQQMVHIKGGSLRQQGSSVGYLDLAAAGSNSQINFGGSGGTFMTIGAYANTNNIDTKNRDLLIFSNTVNPLMFMNNTSGNIGIGTTTPSEKLDINGGNIRLNVNAADGNGLKFYSNGTLIGGVYRTSVDGIAVMSIDGVSSPTNRPLYIGGSINTHVILANAGGFVGIGNTSPSYKLDVNGDVRIVAGSDLVLGSILLGGTGSSNTTPGAYKVGAFDEFTYSSSATVQGVLKDLDNELSTMYTMIGSSAPSHPALSITTNGYSFVSLSAATQTLALSAVSLTSDISGVLSAANGGTGLNAGTAPSGSLLIGKGTGFSLRNISGDASLGVTGILTLVNSGVVADTYGSSLGIPVLTVDSKGRILAASTAALNLNYENPLTFSDGLSRATNTITVDATTTGTTSTTASNSGLEVTAGGVRMLGGCGSNEVLSWNTTLSTWGCSSVSGIGAISGTGSTNYVSKYLSAGTLGNSIIFDDSSRVGIGTNSPLGTLDVRGGIRLGANALQGNTLNTSIGASAPSGNLYWGDRTVIDSSNIASYATTSVTAGNGLSGGGSNGALTIDVGAGNGITVAANSISVDAFTAGVTSTTASNSGLEVAADGVRLLGGCGSNQLLVWNNGNSTWECSTILGAGGLAGTGVNNYVARFSGTNTLTTGVLYDNGTNVGIGTTNPAVPLEVHGRLRIDNGLADGAELQLASTIGSLWELDNYSGIMRFIYGNTEKHRFYGDGNVSLGGGLSVGSGLYAISAPINGMFVEGKVGIGTTNPGAKLDVKGDIFTDQYLSNSSNTFLGVSAAGSGLTHSAGQEGWYNTAIGSLALRGITSGYLNTAVGFNVGPNVTSGSSNVFVGNSIGSNITTGSHNVAIGNAVFSNTDSSLVGNIAIGNGALNYVTGNYGVGIGYNAGTYNSEASNTIIGGLAGQGSANYSASGLTLVGYQAGYILSNGANNNTFIGYQAGNSVTTGANNILIGYNIDTISPTTSDELNIGNAIYGNLSTGFIGIGMTTPIYNLDVRGVSPKLGIIGGNGQAELLLGFNSSNIYKFYSDPINTAGDLRLNFNSTELLTFKQNGNIGIGTTNPINKLDVVGNLAIGSLAGIATAPLNGLLVTGNVAIGTTSPGINTNLALAGGNFMHTALGNPALLGRVDFAGANITRRVALHGKYAYVAAGPGGLQIVDISNTASLLVAGTYPSPSNTYSGVAVSGNFAYLVGGNTLDIFDISKPTLPNKVSSFVTGNGRDIYISGKYAYLTNGNSGTLIIDISNPAAPVQVGSFDTAGYADGVFVTGKYAYVADGSLGLQIVDVSNPASPSIVGTYNTPDTAAHVKVSGKYAYVGDQSSLQIIDISTPTAPLLAGTYPAGVFGLDIAGKYLYASVNTVISVFDISTPSSPKLLGSSGSVGSNCYGVAVYGKYAYAPLWGGGLRIVDINGTETPLVTTGSLQAGSFSISENGDIGNSLYVGNGLNVGLGGIMSDGLLSIGGTGASYIAGYLGVGTAFPFTRLDVNGAVRLGTNGAQGNQLNTMPISSSPTNSLYWGNRTLLDNVNVGNYAVLGINTANTGLILSGSTGSINISLDAATSGVTSTTASNSGLEIASDGLRLLGGCSASQVLSWDAGANRWQCTTPTSGVSGNGVAGRVAFWDTSTALASSQSLYWNNTLNLLGIGTSNPQAALDVKGDIFVNGVIDNPNGDLQIGSSYWSNYLTFSEGSAALSSGGIFAIQNTYTDMSYTGTFSALSVTQSGTGNVATFMGGNAIFSGGNVGIGITVPSYKLDIAGITRTYDLIAQNLILGGSASNIVSTFNGFDAFTNFSGGIGTGGNSTSLQSLERITASGNLVNINSIQGGETILTTGGTFGAGRTYPTLGTNPIGLTLGDINGDKKLDLITVNNSTNNLITYTNNGDGTFGNVHTYSTAGGPHAVTTADINGDGQLDIVVGHSSTASFYTYINAGNGLFNNGVAYNSVVSGTHGNIALKDLNSDGKPDFIEAQWNTNSFVIVMNNGDGTFSSGRTYPAFGSLTDSIAVSDINGDGKQDIMSTNYSTNSILTYLNNGDGTMGGGRTYPSLGSSSLSVISADINQDTKSDIVAVNSNGSSVSAVTYLNDGSGAFISGRTYPAMQGNPSSVAAGDFNGDGKPDLAIASGNIVTYLNDGSGNFISGTKYAPLGSNATTVAVGDLNGDGRDDIVYTIMGSNSIAIMYNQTNTMFAARSNTGFIGIGTSSPDSKLHLVGGDLYIADDSGYTFNNASSLGDLYTQGNLEVDGTIYGTTAVLSQINVSGHITPLADDSYDLGSASYRFRDLYLGPTSLHIASTVAETGTAHDWKLSIQEAPGVSQGNLRFMDGSSEKVVITPSGNLGIGNTNPTEKLSISGNLAVAGQLQLSGYTSDPTNPLAGAMIFNSNTNTFRCYNGSSWADCAGPSSTMYSTSSTAVASGSYITVTHNQNTTDVLASAMYYDSASGQYKQIEDSSKTVKQSTPNEWNRATAVSTAPSMQFHTTMTDSTLGLAASFDTGTGADGNVTVSTSKNINTEKLNLARNCNDGGDAVNYSITTLNSSSAVLSVSPATGCLVEGDEVLIINLQGTTSAFANVGNYETLRVSSVSGNTVYFKTTKSKYYGANLGDDTNIGTATTNQRVMLQRVPNYGTVTVNGGQTFTPSAWDGVKGGVMFFRATGLVSIAGSINANGTGYRGGAGTNSTALSGEAFCQNNSAGVCGGGNGAYGTGGAGSATLGGSGGGGGAPHSGSYVGGAGAGGGYGTFGYGAGGNTSGANGGTSTSGNAGDKGNPGNGGGGGGGGTYGSATLATLMFGSGGGGGGGDFTYNGGTGGAGGGIVYIAANSISVAGTLASNGATGTNGTTRASGGGGGAGGSVYLMANTALLGSSLVTANYGSGGSGPSGYGGAIGGYGRTAVYYSTSYTGNTSTPTPNYITQPYYAYGVYHSPLITTTGAKSYDTIKWDQTLNTYGKVSIQTRSGNSTDPRDGTWSSWMPTTAPGSSLLLQSADTHTDWTSSNSTVADGDVTRNIDMFEDEDEGTASNLMKFSSTAPAYAEATIAAKDISGYDYITFWVRSSQIGNTVKLGFGESVATEQEETVYINQADTWQKVYWDLADVAAASRNGVTKLRISNLFTGSNTLYIDNIRAEHFLDINTGSQITSTPNNYFQYRVIFTTTNTSYNPTIDNISFNYNSGYQLAVVDSNNVRLYNYTGQTQNMKLSVATSGAGNLASPWTDAGSYVYTTGYESERLYDAGGINYLNLGNSGTFASLGWNGADNLTINSAGNIGIGTTASSYKLQVAGNVKTTGVYVGNSVGPILENWWEWGLNDGITGTGLDMHGASTYTDFASRFYRYAGDNGALSIENRGTGDILVTAIEAGNILFRTSSVNRLAITSTGKIGIGTTAPSEVLAIAGLNSTSGTALVVDANGNVFKSSSSLRYKENVKDLNTDFSKVLDLRSVSYNYKDTGAFSVGFIAEEAAALNLPGIVIYDNEGRPDSIRYDLLTVYLKEVVKDQQVSLTGIQSTVGDLTSKVAALEAYLGTTTESTQSTQTSESSSANKSPSAILAQIETMFTQIQDLISGLGLSNEGGALTVKTDMNVLGDTTLNNVTVTGDLTTGTVQISSINSSIDILGASCYNPTTETKNMTLCEDQSLYIQKSLAGNVNMFDGKVVIEPDGTATFLGTVKAKAVEANTVTTNSVQTDELVINDASAILGGGVIKAGQTFAIVNTKSVRSNSRIFVTPSSSSNGQTLVASERLDGVSFKVSIDAPVANDVTFDWWILNVK